MYRVLQFGMTSNYGGVEAFIMNLYRNIDRDKLQFDFLVTSNDKIAYEDEILSLGGRIIRQRFYSRKKNLFKHYKELAKYFDENIDVVAIHANKAVINDIDILIIGRLKNIPVRIIHSHTAFDPKGIGPLGMINRRLLPFFANRFFACSNEAAEYLFGSSKRARIIHDGIDIKKYTFSLDDRLEIRKRYDLSEDDLVVGNVGRFCDGKNTFFLIDIFKEIYERDKNARLLLIGDGKKREEIERKIDKYKLKNACILVGEIIDAHKYYSSMDVFVFPSKFEGFGMALLEAQINGLYCIVAKEGISDLVNVSRKLRFMSLNDSAGRWAEEALYCKGIARYNEVERIKKKGFDIETVVSDIQDIYLNISDKKTIEQSGRGR